MSPELQPGPLLVVVGSADIVAIVHKFLTHLFNLNLLLSHLGLNLPLATSTSATSNTCASDPWQPGPIFSGSVDLLEVPPGGLGPSLMMRIECERCKCYVLVMGMGAHKYINCGSTT